MRKIKVERRFLKKRLSAHSIEAPRFHLRVAAHAPRFVEEVQTVDVASACDRIRSMQLDPDEAEFEPRMGRHGRGRGSGLAQLRATISIAGRSSRSRPSRPSTGPVARTGLRAHFAKGSKGQTKPDIRRPAPSRGEGPLCGSWSGARRAASHACFLSRTGG